MSSKKFGLGSDDGAFLVVGLSLEIGYHSKQKKAPRPIPPQGFSLFRGR
jgi:hypothetical protein